MKVDIIKLHSIFDELSNSTNEELKCYWFRTSRSDGISIDFTVSIYENHASVLIGKNPEISIASVYFKNCSEITILDEKNKRLEILHHNGKGRFLLSLLENPVLEYRE